MEWTVVLWYLLIGVMLVATATLDVVFRRLPVSMAMIYLALGAAVGPFGLQLLVVHPMKHARLLEHLAEVAVIVSLFAAGLKMRFALRDRRWLAPVLLATLGMALTVALVTVAGVWGIGLSVGGAVLLGAVLAPTDPVLASDVQLNDPRDRDRLRFTLTGEAGLNDGTAFPFVLLAVGLYSSRLHDLGAGGWRWWILDLAWPVAGGLLVGWFGGRGVARLVIYLRRRFRERLLADEMLTLGLIALVYGLALAAQTYAFLAVFAAAVAIRREEMFQESEAEAGSDSRSRKGNSDSRPGATAQDSDTSGAGDLTPAGLARAQLEMTQSAERLIEVMLVLLVGSLISFRTFSGDAWWFVPLLLFGIRPIAVYASTWRLRMGRAQRRLAAWFGIRGIGTIYYVAHAVGLGVAVHAPQEARQLVDLCVATICVSVVLHGISATPLMAWYGGQSARSRSAGRDAPATT